MTSLLGAAVTGEQPVGGGCVCTAARVTLADGRVVFVKTRRGAPPGFFATEAAGLAWLGAGGGVPVPAVLDVRDDRLVLDWVPPGPPTEAAAAELGRGLAALHAAGAPAFGRPEGDGFIGTLPLDNTPGEVWPRWYAERRLLPYVPALAADERRAVERVVERIEELAGPPEPPARLHGDLWSGNVHWSAGGPAYVVDPAAHGGHRETDLAMLRLFGAPYADRVVAAYDEVAPLAGGWRDRVALHQLFPLLVHAAMFGGGYGAQAAAAAHRALGA